MASEEYEEMLSGMRPVERAVYLETEGWVDAFRHGFFFTEKPSADDFGDNEKIEVTINLTISRPDMTGIPKKGSLTYWFLYERKGIKPEEPPIEVSGGYSVGVCQ